MSRKVVGGNPSGRIPDMTAWDLNRDGRKEILIRGFNNEYKKGLLAVFDIRSMSGISPRKKYYYQGRGWEKDSEIFHILFPRTDLDWPDHLLENCIEVKILESGV